MTHAGAQAMPVPISGHRAGEAHDLSPGNTMLTGGAWAWWSVGLMGGGAAMVVAVLGAVLAGHARHALAAVHVGLMSVLAAGLGAMFFVMAFHVTMAGWSVTIRRQFENLMWLAPFAGVAVLVLLAVEVWSGGILFAFLGPEVRHDVVYQAKATYLDPMFFLLRGVVYVGVWGYLCWKLWGYSTGQDRTGDRWLSNRARFTSSWGLVVFALSVAFAAFDWLMALDYRFFSTMWGVYYFAGCAFTAVPVVVITLVLLQRAGRLRGLVTPEHYHDLGKFMFGFTVFWAYIAFGQYFLIWYANIPEETAWVLARKQGPWHGWTVLLCVGHFLLPFLVLLWRFVKRTPWLLATVAAWAVLMELADLFWIVRPMVSGGAEAPRQAGWLWLDVAGVAGVWALFAGVYVRRIAGGPLIPLRDPRLDEALHHRNYV